MNKQQFIDELMTHLSFLSRSEREKAIQSCFKKFSESFYCKESEYLIIREEKTYFKLDKLTEIFCFLSFLFKYQRFNGFS